MVEPIANDWARVTGPEGLNILARFLGGDQTATRPLTAIVAAAEAGSFDADYARKS